jgi:hypothetical protein
MAGAWRNALRNWLDGNRSSAIRKTQDPPSKTTLRKLTARGWGTRRSEKLSGLPLPRTQGQRASGAPGGPRDESVSRSGGMKRDSSTSRPRRKSRGHDLRNQKARTLR